MKQKNIILLVVAVGCGIVAFILTKQMSAGGRVETVDVLVAAKDLPVGTTISREDLEKGGVVKVKKLPKDGLPPAFVVDKEQLVDKRLSRPLRAEETFNPADLTKGGAITLPAGHNMMSLPVGVGQAAAGFVGPGSRVDVLATLRLSKQLYSFTLLKNMLVVAVNTQTTYNNDNGGAFPNLSMVSFAVQGRESFLLSLAKTRGCNLELILRHPETSNTEEKNTDKDIEDNIKLLSEDENLKAAIVGGKKEKDVDNKNNTTETPKAGPDASTVPAPTPKLAMVEVLVAKHDIAPNTTITKDLIETDFEWREVPRDYAVDSGAVAKSNYENALNQAIKNGVSKNQWVTWTMVGLPAPKDTPREHFSYPKGSDQPTEKPKKNYLDVPVHTNSGTVIHRYQEVVPGTWKLIATLTPEQAARDPEAPEKGAPDAKKVD